ncbi:MAG: hypothetical protein AAFN30_12225 [Actinomycetota bacterium]
MHDAPPPPSEARRLVIVAYFDQRPLRPLLDLLASMERHPAGCPYERLVVVSTTGTDRLDRLRSAGIPCLERQSLGLNIGAWDDGWRQAADVDEFLFLQDDCLVVRQNWLRAFADACGPGVGLVGESLNEHWDRPWDELRRTRGKIRVAEHQLAGRRANRVDVYLEFMARHGIEPGEAGRHLRGQVWFARRAALASIDGFPKGRNRGEHIASEIAVSRAMEAKGWCVRQVAETPFHYISHREWEHSNADGAFRHAQSVGRLERLRRQWRQVRSSGGGPSRSTS